MSEYQFYEFRAVDKPLTSVQMKELRQYSTRAEITPTGFKNEYNFGSFKGSESEWMEKYFDAHVYTSNWGTFTFMLRLPESTLNEEVLYEYGNDETFLWRQAGDNFILSWRREEEESYNDVYEDDGWMGRLLPIRDELIRGDSRSLYIGWLAGIYETEPVEDANEEEDDLIEPPVPPGLGNLTDAQQALVEYLGVSQELVSVAAKASAPISSGPSAAEAEQWVGDLSESKIRTYLVRLVLDDGLAIQRSLRSQFYRWCSEQVSTDLADAPARRCANELFALEKAEAQTRTKREQEAKEKQEAARLAAAVSRIPQTWQTVYKLAEKATAPAYDQVTSLLVEIRDASKYAGSTTQFEVDLDRFLSIHTSRALRNRLDREGIKSASGKLRLIE